MEKLSKIKVIIIIFAIIIFFAYPQTTSAVALDTLSDTMTRLKVSPVTSSHDILFDLYSTTTLDASETVAIDFHEDDSDFTVAGATTTTSDLGFNDGTERTIVGVDGDCTGHTDVNDIVASINDTTGVLTFLACGSFASSGAGATINVEYGTAAGGTNRITNPTVADTYIIDITAAGDMGKIAVVILTDDQVQLTATVGPSITFTISATSSDFGELPVGSVDTSSPNISLVVGTNAVNGYTITVQDSGDTSNPGLYNSIASYLIGSANATYDNTDTLVGGVEGYGIQASSGDATIAARYDQTGDDVGGLELTATALASYATNMTANHTIVIVHKAAISTFTAAGSYSDTLTYVATGNF